MCVHNTKRQLFPHQSDVLDTGLDERRLRTHFRTMSHLSVNNFLFDNNISKLHQHIRQSSFIILDAICDMYIEIFKVPRSS